MADRWATFDCYGTLVDWLSGIGSTLERLFPDADPEALLARYLEVEPRVQADGGISYRAVMAEALAEVAQIQGLEVPQGEAQALAESLPSWPVFPEVRAALLESRARSWKLAILSNGSPAMLEAVVRNAALGPAFNAVLSVDALRIFKPHPSIYQLAVDRLGAKAENIAFVSSNYWDAAGATSFGFRTFWINRTGIQPDELGYAPHRSLKGLDELTQALAAS
jgi:2-haloacid dehalogenase